MKVRRIGAVFSAGLLVLAFSGCGKAADKLGDKIAEKGIEKSSGGKVNVDSDGKGMSFKDKEGNEFSTGASKTLPDGWPKDILPVPKGFEIINVSKLKQDDGQMRSVTTKGKGDAEAIVSSYKKKLEAGGYEVDSEMASGGMNMISASKGNLNAQVQAMADDDGEVGLSLRLLESAEDSN